MDDAGNLLFQQMPGGGPNNCPPGSPLSCYVNTKCPGGASTTLTGKVYDPAGKVPIYNVIVFVPNDMSSLPVITPGTSSCNTCDVPVGNYVSVTTTDKTGSFTLPNVPTGKNVPLVVQIGKWRRIITVPNIKDCATTPLPSSGAGQARLPKNHQEGDMPQMALLTGALDDLGCFLTRVGIDPTEYSAPQGGGRLDIYQGLGMGLGGSSAAAVRRARQDCRTGRRAIAPTPPARSGRARRASRTTTSFSWLARATRTTRTRRATAAWGASDAATSST